MRTLSLFALVLTLTFTSCSTVKVVSDYDSQTDFTKYKTFAFYKPGIDKAQISDLDKKRIMREIEANLTAKGMSISESPDLLVSIFTKERERVDVYNDNFGWGWGYGFGPWYGGFGGTSVSTSTEGTLFIDFIDKAKNELVWQGIGKGDLVMTTVEKKEARIKEIVSKIIAQYPPVVEAK
ncbi:MAG: DUF4136 domain-containing protein [Flavobacteriaceae bacterium]|nr:DUF4136 domain-containing protein [Flavobacteriaceae bacterium]